MLISTLLIFVCLAAVELWCLEPETINISENDAREVPMNKTGKWYRVVLSIPALFQSRDSDNPDPYPDPASQSTTYRNW
jgi:hypothetical protein